ncbi:MAG: hypothetical protein HYX72_11820 [Acidobacteria bacterium]|nr:hypothetical protein [Acidobacteriota bacterium]
MRMKFGLLVAFAVASLWTGNTIFAQSGSMGSGASSKQNSSQRENQPSSSSKSQGSSRQSDQYGAPSTTSPQGTPQRGDQTGARGQSGKTPEMGTTSSQEMGGTKGTRRGRDASQEIEQNPALASKLTVMLPAGTSAQDAASGFKNVGEFAAAVHVSHNLNIPFDQLKTKVTSGQSLGQAVKDLKPGVDSKAEVKKAKDAAKEDLRSTKQ